MSTITIELDNLTDKEQETVKKLAKKEKKNSIWKPQIGDTYYYISGSSANYTTWDDDFVDRDWLAIGNCFQTEDDAKEVLTRLKILKKWKQLSLEAGEADNPWDKTHIHWYPCYNIATSIIIPYYQIYLKSDGIYFPTRESLEDAIAEIGEDNVKRYILGVTS